MALCSTTRALQYITKVPVVSIPGLLVCPALVQQSVRTINKHWNPKFKKLRAAKVIKVDLPDFEDQRKQDSLTPDQIRARMKEKGVVPPRPWSERPFTVSCTGGVFEPYVPPEGDGKMSAVSVQGAKQKLQFLEKKSKSMMAVRKIRSFEEDFDVSDFAQHATEIYIAAHEAMANHDKLRLREFATEKAYPEMRYNTHCKTMQWKFLKSLEPARVVHARCTDVISKENIFAQITVRMHTQQSLCIWDRFGRVMHGSEDAVRDVLEYVVFEKHVANQYGTWRLHHKILPDWLPPVEPSRLTFIKPAPKEPPPSSPEPSAVEPSPEPSSGNAPAMATI